MRLPERFVSVYYVRAPPSFGSSAPCYLGLNTLPIAVSQ